MSEEGASFTIDIPVTGKDAVDAASAAVDALAASLGNSSKASEAASNAAKIEAKAIALIKRQAEQAAVSAAVKRLKGETEELPPKIEEVAKTSEESSVNLGTLGRSLNKLGGPLGDAGGKAAELGHAYERLSASLGNAAPLAVAGIGLAAVAAAVAALTVAIVSGIIELGRYAIGLADVNAHALLLSQGIARSVAGGTQLNDKINFLAKTLPLTNEELSSMSQRLADSGLRGQALSDALQRAAITASKLKLGPNFEEEMLSLDEQSKVFHANLAETFGGLKTNALMEGLQKLIALFDANTESGHALKVIFESLFQPLVDWLASNTSKVERFFINLEIWVMKALIVIKPWRSTILTVIEVFAVGAAVIGGVFAVAILAVIAAMVAFMAPIVAVIAAIVWLVVELVKAGAAIIDFFRGLDLGAMGKAMIDGLVNGIKAGGTAVFNAIKGVVTGAIDAGKKLLGIASPSAVFAEIGMNTGAGMAEGVDASAGGVKDSLEAMVSPPSASAAGAAPTPGPTAGGGGKSLSGVTFNFYGVAGAEDAESRFVESLTRVLEGDAAQLGAMSP